MNKITCGASIAIFLIIGAASSVYSQTIEDHFLSLPDTSLLGLSKSERKLILEIHKAPKQKVFSRPDYAIEVLDVKNGYLRLGGAMDGRLEMCYWKLGKGKSLVAVYQEGCGPICYVERFDFFIYDGRSYAGRHHGDLIPDISLDFLKKPASLSLKELERRDITANVLFRLPRRGKNITAIFGGQAGKTDLSGFAIGNRMTLQWRDGTFSKGRIFWE